MILKVSGLYVSRKCFIIIEDVKKARFNPLCFKENINEANFLAKITSDCTENSVIHVIKDMEPFTVVAMEKEMSTYNPLSFIEYYQVLYNGKVGWFTHYPGQTQLMIGPDFVPFECII